MTCTVACPSPTPSLLTLIVCCCRAAFPSHPPKLKVPSLPVIFRATCVLLAPNVTTADAFATGDPSWLCTRTCTVPNQGQ